MYCQKCGKMLSDAGRFCSSCGAASSFGAVTTREYCADNETSRSASGMSMHRIVWLVIILAVAVVGGVMMGREFIYRTNTISEYRLKFEQLHNDSSLSPKKKEARTDDLCEQIANEEHVRFEIGLAMAAGGLGLLVVGLIPFWIAKGVRALDRRCGPNKRSRIVTAFGWTWALACGWIFIGLSISCIGSLSYYAGSESEYADAERLFRQGNYAVTRVDNSLRVDVGKIDVWLNDGESKDDLLGRILDNQVFSRKQKEKTVKDLILCLLIGSVVLGMPMWIVCAERRVRR